MPVTYIIANVAMMDVGMETAMIPAVMAFFRNRLVFPIYMILLMPLLVISEHGVELYILNAVAGAVALVSFSFLYKGWLQFLNSLIIFIGMFIIHTAFRLMESGSLDGMNNVVILFIFCNAFLVVAAYPLVFLLEKIFSLVSVATLKDLSDTNNRLLQELARKAPGTFQHSLQVANLAERAVLAIRGNSRLVKVGAMYHDIGKISNPQCFIENQAPGVNYHQGLSPKESAQEIIKHVSAGVELARKHNLPQIVIDFITSHHGRSQTGYFYTQYCNNGGDPADIDAFTYQGTLPTAKEQVVVMMADAVEAAAEADVVIFVGGLIGAALVFFFASLAIRAVGSAAGEMVQEVRNQFADGKIMAGEKEPDYASCVTIATQSALKQMVLPALLPILTPIVFGLLYKYALPDQFADIAPYAVGGLIMVATIVGILMANFLNNGGGAWDNAKKYIEEGHHGGKKSPAHAAAVVGDTVGDPFKDTAGPSIHVLVKLLSTICLVTAVLYL